MTTGSPGKSILRFAAPILAGNLFMQLYYLTDSVIVGQTLGENALAGVGSTSTLTFLLFGLVSGMTAGFTIHTAQRCGAEDAPGIRRSAASAITLAACITLVLTVLGAVGMRPLLRLMQTPEELFQSAYDYIFIIYAALPAQVAYQMLSSLLRALGDSKMPLVFLVLSAALNIILDFVFICLLHTGTGGAALATVISQGISAICCAFYIIKKVPRLHFQPGDFRPNLPFMGAQMRIGIPMALQYSITAIGTTLVQVSLNMLKTPLYIAAFTAASKIEGIVGLVHFSLGTSMATYTAQNTGARKPERISQGLRSMTIFSMVYTVISGIPLILWGKYMTPMFVPEASDGLVTAVGLYLTCSAIFTPSLVIVNLYRNGLQGIGYSFLPMLAGIFELAGRGICSAVSMARGSYLLVCLSSPVAWTFGAALLLSVYFYAKKKNFQKLTV